MPRIAGRDGKLIDALHGSPRTGLVGDAEVAAYWDANPGTPALAVVLGPRSGVFVVDADQHEGGADGPAELSKLEARNGPLPPAPVVLSPSGNGRHLYFRWPTGSIRTGKIAPGVEVLANRAAATLPPSTKRGKPYRWKADRHIAYLPPPPAPAWLLKMAAPPPLPRAPRPPDRKPSDRYIEAAIAGEVAAV